MISFIICSISPEKANALTHNIKKTIGSSCEVLVMDNRNKSRGICKVYNEGAKRAKYENLCFLHEDVLFYGEGWGVEIEHKLAEPNTGVIGFMGATYKSKVPSGWNVYSKINRSHFIQSSGLKKRHSSEIVGDFSPCVVLDGACLFMRKEVWEKNKFDEIMCPGFHGYDIDICIQVMQAGYINYVCGTCWIEHFSEGNFNKEWAKTIITLHIEKWKDVLPLGNNEVNRYIEDRAFYVFIKNIRALSWSPQEKKMLLRLLPFDILHPITTIKSMILLINL